jgi:pimeloyl-ACP methyl ester carboxylesterase
MTYALVPSSRSTVKKSHAMIYLGWFLKAKALASDTFDDAEVDHYAAALATDGALRASLAYYRDVADPVRRNHQALERRHLTLPILGISSSHGSIPDMAASISPWAENATGIVVPDAGHFIPDEQSEAIATALADFITACDRAA